MNLATSLEQIKGVGEKTVEQFAMAGLKTVGDLINFLPRTYEDFTSTVKIADIHPGKMTIQARAESVATKIVRRGLKITTATLADDTGKIQAVWFNQPYRATQLKTGEEFYFSGDYEFNFNRYQLTNPSAELVDKKPTTNISSPATARSGQADSLATSRGLARSDTPSTIVSGRFLPIYSARHGLKSNLVTKIMLEIRPLISVLPETLPIEIVTDEKLVSRAEALTKIHFPANDKDVAVAKERLGYEELFQLLMASSLNKQANQKLAGYQIPFNQDLIKQFVSSLPFQLTNAQRRAAWDILQDFEKQTPMNRLLQGDVGSGKTVVAGLAALSAHGAGFQSAVLAPTEILASQHASTLDKMLSPHGVRIALLTGSVKGTPRTALYEALKNGEIDVVVGTHALIQEAVEFKKLGFVAIDEQHRFGVAQRQELLKKSDRLPHLLAMTATPIPRSLALTLYGEMDISILNERPAGRKEIITKIWSPVSRASLYAQIDKELEAGRQAYVICGLIDDNPQNDLKSVQAEYKKLNTGPFKHRRIGLLHGKMKPSEKDEVMSAFSEHKIDILVSTTVVEVGVDVPNATVMIIEDAERFGLAQLHQLRGRVGRSDLQSYCYLVTSTADSPSRRLKEIEKSNDGFYLAEVDLKLRGPGEIYGRAQHGDLNLQVATLADTKLIARAQAGVKRFVSSGQDLVQYKELADSVKYYQRLTTLN